MNESPQKSPPPAGHEPTAQYDGFFNFPPLPMIDAVLCECSPYRALQAPSTGHHFHALYNRLYGHRSPTLGMHRTDPKQNLFDQLAAADASLQVRFNRHSTLQSNAINRVCKFRRLHVWISVLQNSTVRHESEDLPFPAINLQHSDKPTLPNRSQLELPTPSATSITSPHINRSNYFNATHWHLIISQPHFIVSYPYSVSVSKEYSS